MPKFRIKSARLSLSEIPELYSNWIQTNIDF